MYELTQMQRAKERGIRASKRELAAAQIEHDAFGTVESAANLQKAKDKLTARQKDMREFIKGANDKANYNVLTRKPNREWAGDMPRIITAREKATQFRKNSYPKRVDRQKAKPCNEKLLMSKVRYIERHGGTVLIGGKDVNNHLDFVGADAACIGNVVMFREKPTVSEVLEESFHFDQNKNGDYDEIADGNEARCRKEIDAQKYLLSVTERFTIPKDEVTITEYNLAYYEKLLDDIIRGRESTDV